MHRYAVSIRHFRAHRRFTSQPQQVPEEALKKFETLVVFDTPEYTFRLTQAFVGAVDAAEADADYYYYYFIFASQHDPLAPLSRETSTPL